MIDQKTNMTYSDEEIAEWTEKDVLIFVEFYYGLKNRNYSARQDMAKFMKISIAAMDNYFCGKGVPSVCALKKLYMATNYEIILRWMRIQVKEMEMIK